MAKECALFAGYLPLGGLSRNSVVRSSDRPDMTSAVDHGRKSLNQTNIIENFTSIRTIKRRGMFHFQKNVNITRPFPSS